MADLGVDVLDDVLTGPLRPSALADVRTYFRVFTGRRFERFDGGGDRAGVADVITPSDLVAVSTLSIRWGAAPALNILEERRTEFSELLSAIPHTPLHLADPDAFDDGEPADRFWRLLGDVDGVGPIIAGKILSRKRPHLVPVFDRVVHRLIGSPTRYWAWWQEWFADPEHVAAVHDFRLDVGGIEDIGLLRCLDVVLWMHGTRRGTTVPAYELAAVC